MPKKLRFNQRRLYKFLLAIPMAMLLGFTVPASADIVVTVNSAGSTNVNLGTAGAGKTIDFHISQDASSSDTMAAIFAEFTISGGVIGDPPGTISATGATGTAGYYGAGNLDVSQINRTGDTSFNINQSFDFESMLQPIKNDPERDLWFTLNLDTTGLAPGSYSIVLADPDNSFFDPTAATISANNNLSFTVSAIPEPTSLAVLGLVGIGSVLVRRRKQVRSER